MSEVYGPRLRGVVFFGSRARGDADADSDADFLVLLDGSFDVWTEIKRTVRALRPLRMALDFPLSVIPVSVDRYESGDRPVYKNAKREGIRL